MARLLTLLLVNLLFWIVGSQDWYLRVRNRLFTEADKCRAPLWQLKVAGQRERQFWKGLRQSYQQSDLLREEVLLLEGEKLRLEEEFRVCQLWRDQINQEVGEPQDLVKARISGRRESYFLVINRGWDDGLRGEDPVIYLDNLVGFLSEVGANWSLVRLISSPEVILTGVDQDDPQRSKGIVRGNYGLSLIMDNILPEAEVRPGDVIVTYLTRPGEATEEVLVIGEVASVEGESSQSVKKAVLRSRLDLLNLEEVFVVKGDPL